MYTLIGGQWVNSISHWACTIDTNCQQWLFLACFLWKACCAFSPKILECFLLSQIPWLPQKSCSVQREGYVERWTQYVLLHRHLTYQRNTCSKREEEKHASNVVLILNTPSYVFCQKPNSFIQFKQVDFGQVLKTNNFTSQYLRILGKEDLRGGSWPIFCGIPS